MSDVKFTIDGKECTAKAGQTIIDAAKENGVYIPQLCNYDGLKPAGACRVCTVKTNGANKAACTEPVGDGMVIDNVTDELEDMRKALVEMLFVEGNHFCPSCEKSGNCDLQALGYRYLMLVPRFQYLWPQKGITPYSKILLDENRCVQCTTCIRDVKADGKNVFSLSKRGSKTTIKADKELEAKLTDDQAMKAMEQCPVGAILKKEVGFVVPIGERKYDKTPIGSDIG
ncbi:MAG: 2Fe-2S iron-sulfur cluster binding domain-containing protein [bacterium]|nr:2Fe-2S iron-sulfur cluster binding domain-containing protein [bacterium]